ncbi:MAG: crossover junction endodeoxyribonuclease RuvC [Candidatus Riflebacteria bacterium]|nr:crossover junction endodeoxyribonuclease RuvC [Candidatus Riflebacteria bacterium]
MKRSTTNNIVVGLDLAEKMGLCVMNSATKQILFSSTVKLSKATDESRLVHLHKLLNKIIEKFSPNEIAIEDVFLPAKTSHRTPISLGELRGVARLCAAEHELPVFFYPPRKVKQSITGYGNASKEDIINWVQNEFNIKVKDDNEADAISIAWTHIINRQFDNLIEEPH